MGLNVVDDEEVEAEVEKIEEDEEVARIYEDAKNKHCKIMMGQSKILKIKCMQCNALNGMYVKDVENSKIHVLFIITAICTVARGHKLVAQGWAQFEKMCSEVSAGELPQLLQYVKTHMTPTPTPTQMTSVKQEIKEEPMDVKSEMIIEKLIHISLRGKW